MDASKRINRDGSDSPRKHEDYVSGTKEMLQRSKKPRMTTFNEKASSSTMKWSEDQEILILESIIDYESEFKLSYRSDYDAFYRYAVKVIKANFTKKQLVDQIEHLRKKFLVIRAISKTDDGDLFNLSMSIWGRKKKKKETQSASIENSNQPKDHVPCVEQENRDVPSMEIDNTEKEKSKEDGIDELHILQEIVEAQPSFKSLGKYQQQLLLANLGKLGVEKKYELIDEWKVLVVEELQVDIKKKSFSAKIANGGVPL